MGCPDDCWRVRRRRDMMLCTNNSISSRAPTVTPTPMPALAPAERWWWAWVGLMLGDGRGVEVGTPVKVSTPAEPIGTMLSLEGLELVGASQTKLCDRSNTT